MQRIATPPVNRPELVDRQTEGPQRDKETEIDRRTEKRRQTDRLDSPFNYLNTIVS